MVRSGSTRTTRPTGACRLAPCFPTHLPTTAPTPAWVPAPSLPESTTAASTPVPSALGPVTSLASVKPSAELLRPISMLTTTLAGVCFTAPLIWTPMLTICRCPASVAAPTPTQAADGRWPLPTIPQRSAWLSVPPTPGPTPRTPLSAVCSGAPTTLSERTPRDSAWPTAHFGTPLRTTPLLSASRPVPKTHLRKTPRCAAWLSVLLALSLTTRPGAAWLGALRTLPFTETYRRRCAW